MRDMKGWSYQHWDLWQWCPACLPAERWHGRWETRAAYRGNGPGSQSSPHPPELAHLLGTFGSRCRSLDEEGRGGQNPESSRREKFQMVQIENTRPTCLPSFPWLLPARAQRRSQTPTPCCQRGCFPESTSGIVCHTAGGCNTHTHMSYLLLLREDQLTQTVNICADSPDLPGFPAVVHQRQDATGWF